MKRKLEWLFAIIGSANAIWLAIVFTSYQLSSGDTLFELLFAPGIYFLEMLAFGILALVSVYKNNEQWASRLWITNGALFGFVLLGMMSIGPPLILSFFCFIILAISLSKQTTSTPKNMLVQFLKGLGFQLLFMILPLLLIRAIILN